MLKELNTVLHNVCDGVYLTKDMMEIIGYEAELAGKYFDMDIETDISDRYFTIFHNNLLVSGFNGHYTTDNVGNFLELVCQNGKPNINALYEEVIDLSFAMWELREKYGEETLKEKVLRRKIEIAMVVLRWVDGCFYNFSDNVWEDDKGKEHLDIIFYNDTTTECIFEVKNGEFFSFFENFYKCDD